MRLPRLRFRVYPLMLAAAILALLLWARDQRERSAKHNRVMAAKSAHLESLHRPEHLKATRSPELPLPHPSDRDRDVLEAALGDFAAQVSARNAPHDPIQTIPLSNTTSADTWVDDDRPLDEEDRAWGWTEDLLEDYRRRNASGPVLLTGLKFDKSKVLLVHVDESDVSKEYVPGQFGCITTTLPGYSRDGKTAIVELSASDEYHISSWLCMLVRSQGKWLVKHCGFDASE